MQVVLRKHLIYEFKSKIKISRNLSSPDDDGAISDPVAVAAIIAICDYFIEATEAAGEYQLIERRLSFSAAWQFSWEGC